MNSFYPAIWVASLYFVVWSIKLTIEEFLYNLNKHAKETLLHSSNTSKIFIPQLVPPDVFLSRSASVSSLLRSSISCPGAECDHADHQPSSAPRCSCWSGQYKVNPNPPDASHHSDTNVTSQKELRVFWLVNSANCCSCGCLEHHSHAHVKTSDSSSGGSECFVQPGNLCTEEATTWDKLASVAPTEASTWLLSCIATGLGGLMHMFDGHVLCHEPTCWRGLCWCECC